MNNQRKINKINRISDKENMKNEWHVPYISTLMDYVSKAFSTLNQISQIKRITDEELISSDKAMGDLTKYANEILSIKTYKKYHSFIRNDILPEANKMMNEINEKEIASHSPIIANAQNIIDEMEEIRGQIDRKYQTLETIIRKNQNKPSISNAHWDGYHVELVGDIEHLKKLNTAIGNLSTIDKFQDELTSLQQTGEQCSKEISLALLDKQEELEALDEKINPDNPLFPKKYSQEYQYLREEEKEVQ